MNANSPNTNSITATLKGLVSFTIIGLNTALGCLPLLIAAPISLLLPPAQRHTLQGKMDAVIDYWVGTNRNLFRWLELCDIDARICPDEPDDTALLSQIDDRTLGHRQFSRQDWFLVTSNHQTWADILILQTTLRDLLPPLKFFTKQQLIWVPFLGIAMWMLGFPYVRRYDRKTIAAQPHLKDADKRAIEIATERFTHNPVAVLNFLEGTRFTPAKHQASQARFDHLLNPKAGGASQVITGLAGQMSKLVDVTIMYPHGTPSFWDFLCGRCPQAFVKITAVDIPDEIAQSCATSGNQAVTRDLVAQWLETLWQQKDQTLKALAQNPSLFPASPNQ